MSRWIRIQADYLNHRFFKKQPFTEREAFQYLISNAAWQETTHRIGSKSHIVQRGSMFVTQRELMEIWMWASKKSVETFLKSLENEGMILIKTDAGKSQIFVSNYSKFQDIGAKEEPEESQNGAKTEPKRSQKSAYKDTIHQLPVTTLPFTSLENSAQSASGLEKEIAAMFVEFWKLYPSKKQKPVAEKSFSKAVKEHGQRAIMEGLDRYIRNKPPDHSWLNPSTFLNQERFNDEYTQQPNYGRAGNTGNRKLNGHEAMLQGFANVAAKLRREADEKKQIGSSQPSECLFLPLPPDGDVEGW